MKRIFLICCLLFIAVFVFAQRQASTWYFGNKAGLDFRQFPPTALYNSGLGSLEGCAAISDMNGQILFYTNGLVVNNKNHVLMKNGAGLLGDLSSTSNAVIVPLPGSTNMYFLFTVGSNLQSGIGLRYSIIDMSGDGGLGEVLQKNILIEASAFEKLAAVHHCNKKDVWVTIRKWDTDEYDSYLVTSTGVNTTPVVSHTTFMPTNSIGSLKFSANGKKLAAVYSYESNEVELLDFDNSTGVLSNSVRFRTEPVPAIPDDDLFIKSYGAEFSPNGNVLYISANNSITEPATLYQFNVATSNAATILASKIIIAQTTPWYAGGLQIGPDQKIYMSMWKDTSVSVIEDPDILGAGCNFQYNKVLVRGANNQTAQFGLTGFIQSYFDPRSFYDFTRTGNCADHLVNFKMNKTLGVDSVKWDFGDGQGSLAMSPANNYAAPGFYDVKLLVYKTDCSGLNDTIIHRIWIADKQNFLGPDTATCALTTVQLGIDDIPGANYTWNTGASTGKISTYVPGLYWLEVQVNQCSIRDSIQLMLKGSPALNAGPDTTVCLYKPIILNSGNTTASSYLWNTGETTNSISVNKAGTYYVTIIDNACEISDTVRVTPGDCDAFIPSAFTPNNDGRNERFGVVTEFAVQYFSMQVFDKWGQIIFNSNDMTQKWDGNYKGKNMPNGAYVWTLTYVNRKGQKVFDQGTVMLIR